MTPTCTVYTTRGKCVRAAQEILQTRNAPSSSIYALSIPDRFLLVSRVLEEHWESG